LVRFTADEVLNAASYANPAVAAPHEYISIFGPQLAGSTAIDGTSTSVTMRSEPTAPGLFSANANGMGVATAYQCVSSGNCAATPIDPGSLTDQAVLELFDTGLRHHPTVQAVSATIGGIPATVLFAGAGGGFAGLDQVNVLVPRDPIGKGEVPIVLTVDGKQANSVTVAFK